MEGCTPPAGRWYEVETYTRDALSQNRLIDEVITFVHLCLSAPVVAAQLTGKNSNVLKVSEEEILEDDFFRGKPLPYQRQ